MQNSLQNIEKKYQIALWSVFPTFEVLSDFKENDPDISKNALPAFIRFAHEKGMIMEPTSDAFAVWVQENAGHLVPRMPPSGFSFNDLIDKMAGNFSVKRLVDNELLNIARRFHLPDVQASMISRLRKHFNPNTRPKQNLLRILAFWIGLNRPHWGWNFETLMRLGDTRRAPVQADLKEGVRMAFHITGKGDLLAPGAVEWLKDELIRSMKYLGIFYINKKQVTTTTTTVLVNIPRLKGHAEDLTLYACALGNAAALAHQMLVRWDLSVFGGQGNRIVIAIAAGSFVDMEMYIQTMLKARSPKGEMIRLTPFAHMCANLSEIKMVFNRPPREVGIYDSDVMTIWSVHCLWSYIYYDYVPAVVNILPTDSDSYQAFKTSLFSEDVKNNAVLTTVYRHIQNTLLIVEIARSCLAKGMFHEADHFIAIILANHPFDVVARTLRMVIRLNMAIYRPGFGAAGILFQEAVNEGCFIIERCRVEDEEVFCELGLVYFCIAKRLFNILRNNPEEIMQTAEKYVTGKIEEYAAEKQASAQVASRKILREKVLDNLKQAEACFGKGRTISTSGKGSRSLYWGFRIQALIRLFESDTGLFEVTGDTKPYLTDEKDIFRETARRLIFCLGWAETIPRPGEGYPPAEEINLSTRIFQAFDRYDNSVLLRSYKANVKYASAILLFDFIPNLTVNLIKKIVAWLRDSESDVKQLLSHESNIRTIINCYSQIQPADALLNRIRRAIAFFQEQYADDLNRDDDHIVEKGREVKFTLINFTEEFFAERPFF